MATISRVVTFAGENHFLFKDEHSENVRGICWDLWKRTANELNISYSLTLVEHWFEMFKTFEENKADIIIQRIDDEQMEDQNISE